MEVKSIDEVLRKYKSLDGFKVYGLCDENGIIRYVGKTTMSLYKRLRSHNNPSNLNKKTHLYNWIRSIKYKGFKPTIRLICYTYNQIMLDMLERLIIVHYRKLGYDLVNQAPGGEGHGFGHKPTLETRLKMSKSMMGNKNTPKGSRRPLEFINKISSSKMGHAVSFETRQKLREANLGKSGELSGSFDRSIPNSLIQYLMDNGLTNSQIANKIGKGQKFVRTRIKSGNLKRW